MEYTSARINATSGMGAAFNPPNHPEYTHSVETDLRRKKENRGSMSLSYSLTQSNISPDLKAQIQSLLDKWEATKYPITSDECQKWIKECFAYFGEVKGTAFIRQYYPDFKGLSI